MPDLKPADKTYFGVQALRLVAALLVVCYHAAFLWNDRVAAHPSLVAQRINAQTGVDIFFVISGFVMGLTAPGLAGLKPKAQVFLWRRLVRIVPLYWLFTTLKIVRLWLGPTQAHDGIGGWWQVVASYLFIPNQAAPGFPIPILTVGWTLNYEMMFYVLFAVALALDLSVVWFLSPVLLAIAGFGWFALSSVPVTGTALNPLVLEFWYGLLIAQLVLQGRRPPWTAGLLLFGGGFAALLLAPESLLGTRAFSWGLPAAAVVLGTIALESSVGRRLPRWLLELGNASYSIYLIHGFLISFVWIGLLRLGLRGPGSRTVMIVAALVSSTLGGELVHRLIELPLLKALRGRRVPGVSVLPGRQTAT